MSRRALWIYGGWMAALVALYLMVPAFGLPVSASLVLSSAVAICLGVRGNRPRRRLPWLLLAGGTLAFGTGGITAVVLSEVLHQTAFPSLADAIFLGACFPMLLLGLLSLTRSGAAVRDRASMIDALILTAGAGFLSWVFLISPHLNNPHLSALEKAISIAYPLCDVLILAILARIVIGAVRNWSLVLLLVSGASLLAADVLYGLSQLNGDWHLGGPVDLGWLVFYLAGGAAALHPSMVELTEPKVLRQTQVTTRRAVLGVASLIAPTVLLVEALNGSVRDGIVIAVVSALLVLLAIARMSVVASGLRRSVTRERELRRASEALLSISDTAEVSTVVHAAVASLLPPGTRHRVVLTVVDPADACGKDAVPSADPAGQSLEMVYARALPEAVAGDFADFDLALRCRLSVRGRRVGDLFVAAGELALVSLQDAVPVLAGQAASVLYHIALNREISRRDSEAYFRTLVLNAADVILMVDDDNRITYASPSAAAVFGVADMAGADLLDLVEPEQRAGIAASVDAVRAGADGPDLAQWTVRRASGEPADVEVAIRDLRHERTVGALVLTLRDVTERRWLERELLRRAYLDPLTGLGNRLRFQDEVQKAARHAAGAGTTAGVLVVNVDDFKIVNTTMGHVVGDELLVAIGQRLVEIAGARGNVARLGGDEFGVTVADADDAAHVEYFVGEVVAGFAVPFVVSQSMIPVQVSVGVATTAHAADGHQLLSQAEVALGTAKSAGKGRWRRYEQSLHAEVLERMRLRADLDQAIADGAFVLHYQPIVDLDNGTAQGFEALVRWLHPTRGMVPPLQFIQIAEESGLIVALGAWVLRNAIAAAAAWPTLRPSEPPYVSVNVSVRQFRTPGFVSQVFADLAAHGLPPHLLTLEITESLLLGDEEQIHADIATLRQAGVKVAIDDFGTGYSSLSYLHRVPVDTLKLDKSFVETISSSAQQLNLVRGIIQLAGTLRFEVVAEGIETDIERTLLLDAGCGFGQGYLFARPMSLDDVHEWLLTRPTTVEASHAR